jgi:hypothetical protein
MDSFMQDQKVYSGFKDKTLKALAMQKCNLIESRTGFKLLAAG